MGNYSDKADSIRVDFFKETGKWYTTEAVIWTGRYHDGLIDDELRQSLKDHFLDKNYEDKKRLYGMTAVCLEPYHTHCHPMMILLDDRCYYSKEELREKKRDITDWEAPLNR